MKTEVMNEEWVMSRRNRNHGLAPIRRALQTAGNPQDELRTVHIAGTNGKGSTTNYLKDILMSQGYHVGTFTSPHLVSHRDRIRIDDVWISSEEFREYLQRFADIIEQEDLGMFEIDTLIAFTWMRDRHVDYALMETGLGGRLDNTNVIRKPELEIITTIGFDHMAVLGSRLAQIANEKAGIIMPYSRCVCGYIDDSVKYIISRKAERVHAACSFAPPFDAMSGRNFRFAGEVYTISGDARYQKKNASLALYAAWMLGVNIRSKAVKEAIRTSMWAGRFETVGEHPGIILDGAHNEEGMKALVESTPSLPRPLIIVFSALKDKPGKRMGDLLRRAGDHLIITEFHNLRADTMAELGNPEDEQIADYAEAIERGRRLAGQDGTLLITGSLYFISLARAYLTEPKAGRGN